MAKIKYRDYRIGHNIYTVKVKRLNETEFHIFVFDCHPHPRNFFARCKEWWTIPSTDSYWDCHISNLSLEEKIIKMCETYHTGQNNSNIDEQWEKL